jgi:YggT family protein
LLYIAGYFFTAVARILDGLLLAYLLVVIAQALLSWVRPDPYNPIVRFINSLVNPVAYRISRIVPTRVGMMDFSPLILIVLIEFLRYFLVPVLMRLGLQLQ